MQGNKMNDKEIIESIMRNLDYLNDGVINEWLFVERIKDRIGRRDG